jgi:hypothetical protein
MLVSAPHVTDIIPPTWKRIARVERLGAANSKLRPVEAAAPGCLRGFCPEIALEARWANASRPTALNLFASRRSDLALRRSNVIHGGPPAGSRRCATGLSHGLGGMAGQAGVAKYGLPALTGVRAECIAVDEVRGKPTMVELD